MKTRREFLAMLGIGMAAAVVASPAVPAATEPGPPAAETDPPPVAQGQRVTFWPSAAQSADLVQLHGVRGATITGITTTGNVYRSTPDARFYLVPMDGRVNGRLIVRNDPQPGDSVYTYRFADE